MNDKLLWLTRSYERMLERIDDPVEVQDHFWSFLHASRLIWFYFGKWLNDNDRKDQAGSAVDRWKESLEEAEAEAWDLISSLRTEDVHIRPVETKNIKKPENVTVNGAQVTVGDDPVVAGNWVYQTTHERKEVDIFSLCKTGISILGKFIHEFDRL